MDVGVIGVGKMGRNHVRVYSESKKVNNLFVYDSNQNASHKIAIQQGATSCESIAELLDVVDAVSICVPTQYHSKVGKEVLASGVHMLMEKPLCSTVQEAEDLICQVQPGTVVGVGHIERFNPIVNEIKRISKAPLFIEINRHNPSSDRISKTSVVHDLMIHDIDILRHVLTEKPYELTVSGTKDIGAAMFRIDTTTAFLSASRKSSKKIRRIYIEEEEFTIEGDFMTQEIYSFWKPDEYHSDNERYSQENIIEKVLVNKVEPLKSELSMFLNCAKSHTPFPVTLEQACENLRVCDLIETYLV
jgi:predicted dehydrogenase